MFKNISYLEFWWSLSSIGQNILCNFSRMHHEGQFCEINLLWWHLCSAEQNHLCIFCKIHHEE